MNLDDFLHTKDADLHVIMKSVDAQIGLRAGDTLLAVGSLVEGLGNIKSDVDLVLLTSRENFAREMALVVGRCVADIQVMPIGELESLIARFNEWMRAPWDVMRAASFAPEERRLLHRLRHNHRLWPGDDEPVITRLPTLAELSRLKLHVARQMARTIQVDLVGLRDCGDHRSLVFAAQDLLGHAVDALVAAHHHTNPTIKWRSRLLERLPADWESALTVRPTGLAAHERVWRLHRAPEHAHAAPALAHALRIVSFARAVFAHAERRLIGHIGHARPCHWPSLDQTEGTGPLPYLDLDVDFCEADGRISIGRLNEFGEALELSSQEFSVTLLFDGATTACEAGAAVYGLSDGTAPTAINRLVDRIAKAKLSIAPVLHP